MSNCRGCGAVLEPTESEVNHGVDRRDRLLLPASAELARYGPCARHATDHSRNALVGMDSDSAPLPRAYPQDASAET
jgi:hypothetical protein